MNISIENKELSINNAEDLMAAHRILLEAFTESLMKSSEKEQKYEDNEKKLLEASGAGSIDDLIEWLEDMRHADYAGKSTGEIRDIVMAEELGKTDFDTVDEIVERMDDMTRTFENIYSEISEYI